MVSRVLASLLVSSAYRRARLRFWLSSLSYEVRFSLWQTRMELLETWRDYRLQGDGLGHVRAFWGWLTGKVTKNTRYTPVRKEAAHD